MQSQSPSLRVSRHRQVTCPQKVSNSSNLRHARLQISRRVEVQSSSCSSGIDVSEASWKLPAAAAAGVSSLLLLAPAALAVPAQAVYASHKDAAPAHASYQQQLSSLPASLQAYVPAAAPSVLASPAQHAALAPAPETAGILQASMQDPMQQQTWQHAQQQSALQELQQLSQLEWPRTHWLLVVLGIGVINILGLQAVLKMLQASKDSSTPVTVLVARLGLRVDNKSNKLQERLHFLRDMMGVEHAMFFTFEEAMQAICNPPRGCQLAYADLEAFSLMGKQAGYDTFKQKAMIEVVRAEQEEEANVQHGSKPEGPNHRNMLQKLLGAAETQDAENTQACLLVTLVVLAKGKVSMPQEPLRSQQSFKESIKSLCGHLKLGQLLAVELLMTPDSPQDFLSEAQLMADYPFLTDLASGLRIDHPDWSLAPSPFASTDDYGGSNVYTAEAAAAAMAAMVADVAGADGAASAAAAAAALRDERAVSG